FHPTDVIEDADGSLLIMDTGGWYKLCCPSSQLVKPDVKGAVYRVKKLEAHKTRSQPKKPPLSPLYSIALNRDAAGLAPALAALRDDDLHIRRLAAEAIGRIGDPKAIPAILAALADEKNDLTLDHALTYALIEIGNPAETAKGLSHKSPRVRRAVLTALNQMPGGNLEATAVLAELDSKDAAFRETAWWVAGKHPEWGQKLAKHFENQLDRTADLTATHRDELASRLAKFADKNQATLIMLGDVLKNSKKP